MKSIDLGIPDSRRPAMAAALAALLCTGAAVAAPSYQASVDPVVVGSTFTMVLRDDAIDPSTGVSSFDVRITFDPAALGQPVCTAGSACRTAADSAFGNAAIAFTYDVLDPSSPTGFGSDGFDDPGWARFSVTRDAGVQPSTFGADILRLDFRVVGLPPFGPIADITYLPLSSSAPGEYAFPAGVDTFTASVGILAFVPEPATAALLLAGLGLLCTARRGGGRDFAPAAPLPAAA